MHKITVSMVSDVVCPWCIVGYKRLKQAIDMLDDIEVEIQFHPFELNPNMPEQGQNLRDHIVEKYGVSAQQSDENRERLVHIGNTVGFSFNFSDESRMYNTFKAHQLIHIAAQKGLEESMKLRLFSAYFTEGKNINEINVLVEEAVVIGLDKKDVEHMLTTQQYATLVRQEASKWLQRGIQSVPTFVVGNQGVAGAQDPETLAAFLRQAASTAQ